MSVAPPRALRADRAGGAMRREITFILAAVALASAACNQKDEDAIRDDSSVADVRSCADLKAEIESMAIREMNAQIDEILAGLDKPNPIVYGPASSPSTSPVPSAPTEGRDSATDYTTTNTQERGVDEPDFVKNDGSRIFVLNGRQLVAVRAWPPESARLESSTTVAEGDLTPVEMFFHKNRVVVFSRSYGDIYPYLAVPAATTGVAGGGSAGSPIASSTPPDFRKGARLVVTVLDVSGNVPTILHEQQLEGAYVSARRTEDVVRFVTVAPRRGPDLIFWPDRNVDWSRPNAVRQALEEARKENVRRIRASSLEDWLPRAFENGAPVPRECGSFLATNVSARLGFTTVSSLDLGNLQTSHQTILNPADEVYASTDALYLTARHYWSTPPSSDTQIRQNHTYVFQFDARSQRTVRYVASGGVAGHIVDQFSLDEQDGYLRIATTRRTTIGWRNQDTTNNLFVLHAEGSRLRVVGEIDGLARDESIYSARFEGPRGYLVTFRQVDPLFTLDLRDPRQPLVAGELKVPGFSTYLHPLDRDHLLTIGREVTDNNRQGGVQLQVFDVSSFANPQLLHRYTLGSASSSSEAGYDHRAFTYFTSRGLLAIPFSDWSSSGRTSRYSSTLQVLRATVGGIAPVGSVEHADLLQGTQGRYPYWTPQVRRGVMMDDYVYSISYGGLKVNDTRDLSRTVATIPFP
jgi:hypothetical protein